VLAGLVIVLIVVAIFAVDAVKRWKRDGAWKRRWESDQDE
jgi:hypothetical protein